MTDTDPIKAGDTVRMKSGSPLMTVKYVNADEATCEWFDDKKQPQLRVFSLTSLVKDDGSFFA